MNIEIPDEIARRINYGPTELKEILALSLYKMKKINGVEGGKILDISEMEFHGLLGKYGQFINYDLNELNKDIDNLKDF